MQAVGVGICRALDAKASPDYCHSRHPDSCVLGLLFCCCQAE